MTGDNKKRAWSLLSVRKRQGEVVYPTKSSRTFNILKKRKWRPSDTFQFSSSENQQQPFLPPPSNRSGEGSILPPPLPSVFKMFYILRNPRDRPPCYILFSDLGYRWPLSLLRIISTVDRKSEEFIRRRRRNVTTFLIAQSTPRPQLTNPSGNS